MKNKNPRIRHKKALYATSGVWSFVAFIAGCVIKWPKEAAIIFMWATIGIIVLIIVTGAVLKTYEGFKDTFCE